MSEKFQLDMVKIPSGKFMRGSSTEENGHQYSEEPYCEVFVPEFYMGRYPVTQKQWRWVSQLPKIELDLNPDPSKFKSGSRPVECISWYEAVEFCKRLSVYTGKQYRLPSEAEWEYACRAGTTTPFHFGPNINDTLANYQASDTYAQGTVGKFRQQTTEVGLFKSPNPFGLYDMHGNIWEWCLDTWHDNYNSAPSDGTAWIDSDNDSRILRGGSWVSIPSNCRSACRFRNTATYGCINFGFRVVCLAVRDS